MRRSLPSLQRLRALEAVVRLGGFSAAADEMLLTQSAVSNQIKRLEDEVGARLVERVGKRAKPTAEGRLLLAAADDAFAALDGALRRIADSKDTVTGRFVVGGGGTAATYHLPPLLARFAEAHPQVEVNLHLGLTPELVHGLIDGAIDVIVATEPVADPALERAHFADDRLVCAMPPGDDPVLTAVRARDLAGRRLVLFEKGGQMRDAVDAWLRAGGDVGPHHVLDVGLAEAQKSFVIAGFGWSIIPEIAVAREVAHGLMTALPLTPPLTRPLTAAWRRDRAMNPAIRALRAMLGGKAGASFDSRASS